MRTPRDRTASECRRKSGLTVWLFTPGLEQPRKFMILRGSGSASIPTARQRTAGPTDPDEALGDLHRRAGYGVLARRTMGPNAQRPSAVGGSSLLGGGGMTFGTEIPPTRMKKDPSHDMRPVYGQLRCLGAATTPYLPVGDPGMLSIPGPGSVPWGCSLG
jgi:hypothetical protein